MSATLAARVKAARDAAGLSQRQLPGVDSGLLSRIETGKVKDPAISTLTAIAKATGTTVDQLNGASASAVRSIELRDLLPDPKNPRAMQEGDAADQAFMQSIKDQGLLQPLAVRHTLVDNIRVWMVVDGHRRYAALVQIHGPRSKVLVPCRVIEADDTQTLLLQLVANVQRADMNPWDLSRAIGDLVDQKMDTQAIADALGRKRRWVQEMASVGRNLHNHARVCLANGSISISQAVAIAAEKDAQAQQALVQRTIDDALNEDQIRAITADKKEKAAQPDPQSDLEDFLKDGGKEDEAGDPQPHSRLLRWKGAKGTISVQIFKLPNVEEYTHAGDCNWRAAPGGYSWHWSAILTKFGRKDERLRTWPRPSDALIAALVCGFNSALRRTDTNEDEPLLKLFIAWAGKQYRQIGGPVHGVKNLQDNLTGLLLEVFNSREASAALKAPPKAKPAPAPPSLDELRQPPGWAEGMRKADFVVISTGATLCDGWASMVEALDAEHGRADVVRLHERHHWYDATDGTPFSYGELVYRVTARKHDL